MKNYQSINSITEDVHNPGLTTPGGNNAHSQDNLAPPFESDERLSNLFVGSFNLIATTLGGGVLSLPIVFEKCGVAFTTLAMILSAYMTYMTLNMLCYCSRRGGGSSYGEVARSAFGQKAEEGVSWVLFAFLMFVTIGYMVLIRDIMTPLVQQVLRMDVDGDYVLLTITVLLLPLLLQRSLHALRYNCYVGFASISILCIAFCLEGWQHLKPNPSSISDSENDNVSETIDFFKIPSPQVILFSFPIVTLAFSCHVNIIAVQNALSKPTRKRMQNLTQYTIGVCFLLMYIFGLGGYLYAGNRTLGNILLNVPLERQVGEEKGEYYLLLLGRIGCGVTMMLAVPMMVLPCREAILEVIDVRFHHSHRLINQNTHVPSTENSCWALFRRFNIGATVQDSAITPVDEVTEILTQTGHSQARYPRRRSSSILNPHSRRSVLIRHAPIQNDYIFRNTLLHYGSTVLIATTCYLGAVAMTGVATVWSFVGASMGFFFGFILPCGCFIVIETEVPTVAEGGDRKDTWIRVAWVILAFSIVGAVACTVNNTMGFGR